MLAAGEDRIGRPADAVDVFAADTAVLLHEIRHGIINAIKIGTADTGRTRGFRTAAIKNRIVIGQKRLNRHIHADINAAMEGNTFTLDLLDTAIDEVLLHLEIRNAVTQQPAGLRFALEDMNLVAGAAKLLRSRHAGWAGTDDGNLLAGVDRRRLRHDKAQLVSLVGNRLLDGLDGDRRILEVQRAGFLAGCGTDAAGEFREVVGGMEVADRLFPVVVIDQIVPVGDLVVHGTARRTMTVWNAAIHAACRLLLHLGIRHRNGEFAEMADTIRCGLILAHLPVDFQKTCYLAHVYVLTSKRSAGRAPVPGGETNNRPQYDELKSGLAARPVDRRGNGDRDHQRDQLV
ncbi:hypothetical protein D3C71_1307200 [compost metagenome]